MKFENKKRLIPMPYKSWFCLFLAASVCFVAGCGQSGPRRYNVEGTVTLGGKPVPAGEVRFEPDTKKGNHGPQSRAKIQNGKYRTPRGKGPVSGPAIVRINCYDGNIGPESPMGINMAKPYVTNVDLPQENSAQDFEVPASYMFRGRAGRS